MKRHIAFRRRRPCKARRSFGSLYIAYCRMLKVRRLQKPSYDDRTRHYWLNSGISKHLL